MRRSSAFSSPRDCISSNSRPRRSRVTTSYSSASATAAAVRGAATAARTSPTGSRTPPALCRRSATRSSSACPRKRCSPIPKSSMAMSLSLKKSHGICACSSASPPNCRRRRLGPPLRECSDMNEQSRILTADRGDDLAATRLRLVMLHTHAAAGQGHLGSSLSIVEILTALLATARREPGHAPREGDRIVLSKGHAALGLYCALAEAGTIPHAALATFGQNGSALEPHPNEVLLPQVAASTGSLGQGLSIGLGLAHGSRLRGRGDERTAVILGGGGLNEGEPWGAARGGARRAAG